MTKTGVHWYVVQTHANAEARAALNLTRQGYAIYLPRYRKRRRHARRIDLVAAPLFPRYLFVLIDMAAQRWRTIGSTFGVTHLVCCGDEPAIVPDRVIADLQAREDASGFLKLDAPAFARGTRIRIRDGVFTNSLGLFEGMPDRKRVAVLLDLLGRKVRIVMEAESIEAA